MTLAAKKVLADALVLSDEERLQLAGDLLASVDGPPDTDWQQAWITELERRKAEIDDGKIQLIDGREALAKARNLLDKNRGK